MTHTHNLGFPRIGEKRELKFALEEFWSGNASAADLEQTGENLRKQNWKLQQCLDFIPVGDFSNYDHVLDMSVILGNVPDRAIGINENDLDTYFRIARGRSNPDDDCHCIQAGELTKWFDTNYHYIVPEVDSSTQFSLNPKRLINQVAEAEKQGINYKPVIIGPITYLWLCKEKDDSNKLDLLDKLIPIYIELLETLEQAGAQWVQIDEPALVTDLDANWKNAYRQAYAAFAPLPTKLLLTTYFGELRDNLDLACSLPVAGLHIEALRTRNEISTICSALDDSQILSLGIVDGRNVWKADICATLDWLEPIAQQFGDRLWIAPSCSLLHVPINLENETEIEPIIKDWLAFAQQKLQELSILKRALIDGRDSVQDELGLNQHAIASRKKSRLTINPELRATIDQHHSETGKRQSPFEKRSQKQRAHLNLPDFPTTTIGSFPQTKNIRQARLAFRKQKLSESDYTELMKSEIANAIREQSDLGLDVFVHGEAERNDMVEYFGENLSGFTFSKFGWVQSYGSRCVKPPILYGDVSRPQAITLEWIKYAQSLTDKPVKGMLTGPVTILNWSFVRDDQPRSETCKQIAFAIRDEVLDLESSGVSIIQIDEAALREGLPLRKSDWQAYIDWAIHSFCIAANGVRDETQIHTHMCYSEFNDILPAISKMDADVITIETSRSDLELLDLFDEFDYPNEIGPGVYDIHSPNIPSVEYIVNLVQKASARIPANRLWVNPDCGLKTRQWSEVIPALKNMIEAAQVLRQHSL